MTPAPTYGLCGPPQALLKKLEELGQANAREKKELEDKLSKVRQESRSPVIRLLCSGQGVVGCGLCSVDKVARRS